MEARDGAAGNGDEQHGEDGLAIHDEAVEGIDLHTGTGRADADDGQDDDAVEQEGIQIVTGLEQDPHGHHGGDEDVHQGDHHPGVLAHAHDGEVEAGSNAAAQQGHAHHGVDQGVVVAALQQAEEHRQGDEQQGGRRHGTSGAGVLISHSHSRVVGFLVQHAFHHVGFLADRRGDGGEGTGHDVAEGRHHQQQHQEHEDVEDQLGLAADVLLNHLADGLAIVADGSEQGGEVLHAAEEDAADHNPQKHRNPAEERGLDGAGDGARTGDGGEVMAQKHRGAGRHIVVAVVLLNGRGLALGVDAPLLAQPGAVGHVGDQEQHDGDDQNEETVHLFPLP